MGCCSSHVQLLNHVFRDPPCMPHQQGQRQCVCVCVTVAALCDTVVLAVLQRQRQVLHAAVAQAQHVVLCLNNQVVSGVCAAAAFLPQANSWVLPLAAAGSAAATTDKQHGCSGYGSITTSLTKFSSSVVQVDPTTREAEQQQQQEVSAAFKSGWGVSQLLPVPGSSWGRDISNTSRTLGVSGCALVGDQFWWLLHACTQLPVADRNAKATLCEGEGNVWGMGAGAMDWGLRLPATLPCLASAFTLHIPSEQAGSQGGPRHPLACVHAALCAVSSSLCSTYSCLTAPHAWPSM